VYPPPEESRLPRDIYFMDCRLLGCESTRFSLGFPIYKRIYSDEKIRESQLPSEEYTGELFRNTGSFSNIFNKIRDSFQGSEHLEWDQKKLIDENYQILKILITMCL
jgi:hypothetical protein